jgi:glucoamylase
MKTRTLASLTFALAIAFIPRFGIASGRVSLVQPALPSSSKGIPHTWPNAAKEMVGSSYGANSSHVWFTSTEGIVSEVSYPRIDRPQSSDTQMLFSELGVGQPSFLEEKRDFQFAYLPNQTSPRATITGKYSRGGLEIEFTKEILIDPTSPVLRVRYVFSKIPKSVKLHVLHKPTAEGDGAEDVARLAASEMGPLLVAWDNATLNPSYQILATNGQVEAQSVGAVGVDDGWQQLNKYGKIKFEIDAVGPTNLALTSSVNNTQSLDVAVGFGSSLDEAYANTKNSLSRPFEVIRAEFDAGWKSYLVSLESKSPWLSQVTSDVKADTLWNAIVVKTHEDKLNPGAIIASLSTPDVPQSRGAGDGKNIGGYHLVWPRDLYKSARALLRLGDTETALNALRFMMRQELSNGQIAQNSWVDGKPYWVGQQMDQEAFPLILAAQLKEKGVILDSSFDAFLLRRKTLIERSSGFTSQERWEEESGYSPNTLAVLAAAMVKWNNPSKASEFVKAALEKTTVRNGTLSNDGYFMRIAQRGLPDAGDWIEINNGGPWIEESRSIDGGFLEWSRWFIDLEQSFGAQGAQLETVLRNTISIYDNPANGVSVPFRGVPLFRRYNSDAYGFLGKGGPWPILTAERYLPDMRKDPKKGLDAFKTVRSLWTQGQMCPEQLLVQDNKAKAMPFAASPLVWCHAGMVEDVYRSTLTVP